MRCQGKWPKRREIVQFRWCIAWCTWDTCKIEQNISVSCSSAQNIWNPLKSDLFSKNNVAWKTFEKETVYHQIVLVHDNNKHLSLRKICVDCGSCWDSLTTRRCVFLAYKLQIENDEKTWNTQIIPNLTIQKWVPWLQVSAFLTHFFYETHKRCHVQNDNEFSKLSTRPWTQIFQKRKTFWAFQQFHGGNSEFHGVFQTFREFLPT